MTGAPLQLLASVDNTDGMADRPLLNEQIKALQENAKLTNEVAARIMGVPLRTYMRWRSGQSEPGVDGLIALGDLYGVSLNALIGVEAPRKRFDGDARLRAPPGVAVVDGAVDPVVPGCAAVSLRARHPAPPR